MKKLYIPVILLLSAALLLSACSNYSISGYKAESYMPERYSYTEDVIFIDDGQNYDPEASAVIENPFVSVNEKAVSTFSADVDTASYSILRRELKGNYTWNELVATSGDYIRTEELINYFSYDYKQPGSGDELFGLTSKLITCPWNNDNLLLIIGLQTEKAVNKTANNLVFLIDISGSMSSSDKLPLLQKTFSYLTSNLGADDTVSIVTYASGEEVILEGCEGSKTDMIQNAIDKLEASGSTNGEAGLRKAYELAEKYYKPEGNNRIIMASDGDLNVGMSSVDEIKDFVLEKSTRGLNLSVLGFGYGNYRDSIMEAVADNGNGVYYYVDCEEEAEKIFGTDLLSTLYTVANDVKLQITFNKDAVSEYRLIGYENRIMSDEDFDNEQKDAGDVGAGHSVTVCYEIKPVKDGQGSDKLADLAVKFKKPGDEKSRLNE